MKAAGSKPAELKTPPFMTPKADPDTPPRTPPSRKLAPAHKQQQLPPNLVHLLTSLESEFEDLNSRYVGLLSTATTDSGTVRMKSRQDEASLKNIGEAMERKEEQMKMLRDAVMNAATVDE